MFIFQQLNNNRSLGFYQLIITSSAKIQAGEPAALCQDGAVDLFFATTFMYRALTGLKVLVKYAISFLLLSMESGLGLVTFSIFLNEFKSVEKK